MKALQIGGKLSCGTTDCANELHCFNRSQRQTRVRKGKPFVDAGVCGACGKDPGIPWERLHRCDPVDTVEKISRMREEYIREYFWTHPFTEKVMNHALKKGRIQLYDDIPKRIAQAVGKERHPAEGRQTPVEDAKLGNVIQYAQHSVAACCRPCVEKWHGIETGRALTATEIDYLSGLVRAYLEARLPNLPETPTYVPRTRKAA